jgi:dihydroflavonol-4-reductase
MAVTLVTGGSGFLGSHVARLLHERGDELRLAMRPSARRDALDFPFQRANVDLRDRQAVRRAMRGVERVFHVAGCTNLRASVEELFAANVQTTQVVLEEALRAGVQRVVHTSSVAAVGPARRGRTADENERFRAATLGIPYVDAKREAELYALRLAGEGLPVVVVCPATTFGAGDPGRSSTSVVRRFLRREIPAYVDGAVNVVDVRDVARGHLLADERGTVGERYILGNRNFTIARLFGDLARLSGVEPPAIKLPYAVALALADTLTRIPGVEAPSPIEVRAMGQWWAYRSTKAQRELGFQPGHHEEALERTIEWYRERDGALLASPGARQPLVLRLAGAALREGEKLLPGVGG